MSLQGFKNLLNRALLVDESIQPLLKKSDEYRKVTQTSIDHFQLITRNYESYFQGYEKMLFQLYDDLEASTAEVPQYYNELIILFRNVNAEVKIFSEVINGNFKELTTLCSTQLLEFSNLTLSFQQLLRNYQASEQILFQLSKKYFRTHRNMLIAVDSYKNSFTDVKLIYNMDEKHKRYIYCEATYRTLLEDYSIITDKTQQLSSKKDTIILTYLAIAKELKTTLKMIADKLIAETKNFMTHFCQMHKIVISFLAERKFTLQKIQLKAFFYTINNVVDEELFTCKVEATKCQLFPSFVVYSKSMKDDCLPLLSKAVGTYLKDVGEKIQKRKLLNRKVFDFVNGFFKLYERAYYTNLKEVMGNFQRVRKRIAEIFGGRMLSFLKSINSIFELSIGINEKLFKRIASKMKNIETHLAEENKLLDLLLKELRASLEKLLQRKKGDKNESEEEATARKEIDEEVAKNQIELKTQYIYHILDGFQDKMAKNYDQLKLNYNGLVNDLSLSINQFYSLCCEYKELYFGREEYANNYRKYELDIETTISKETQFFLQINFGSLLKEQAKIVFESEMAKVEEFKKMKKPIEIQVEEKIGQKKQQRKDECESTKQDEKNPKSSSKLVAIPNEANKYEDFLLTKISFNQNEKLVKSFSCGFTDKIILTGRLYITTTRLCFHSKFNPSTVFFGETFIQIPKKDIKKIEKRHNAIFFDNSISITTVNGEMFFTSFFSRNEAYEMMCNVMEINVEDIIYEPVNEEMIPVILDITQDDDMKEETIEARKDEINASMVQFDFKNILQCEFSFKGLNALKMFKLFDGSAEVTINRRTYPSFLYHYKELLQHKEFNFGEWVPNIEEYLNSVNLKDNAPIRAQRKLQAKVPIVSSGVPFMPKQADSEQVQTLYFFSRNKYVIESVIQNSGAPYTDSFNVQMRKTVQSVQENKCKLSVEVFFNFITQPMIKSIIESKGMEETKSSVVKLEEAIKKYLKKLQKTPPKHISSQDAREEKIEDRQQIQQIEEKYEQLQKRYASKETEITQIRKVLFVSILLNILLLLLWVL